MKTKRLHFLLLLAVVFPIAGQAHEILPLSTNYDLTENGYYDAPLQTAVGIVFTDNRQQSLYLLRDGEVQTLVSSPGCGRYIQLSSDKLRIAYKYIDCNGKQAPAVFDLRTMKQTVLAAASDQCGQPTFGPNGEVAYTIGKTLHIVSPKGETSLPLNYYTNIVRYAPNGRWLAWSDYEGMPVILNLKTMQQQRLATIADLYDPRWSPSGERLVYQQGNMSLYVFDIKAGTTYKLGNGFGAQWTDDQHLIYSRAEYAQEDIFAFTGISIVKSSYDGEQQQVLIDHSPECPQEVGIGTDKQLLIAYANGNRRIVSVSLAQPQKETVLYALTDGPLPVLPLPATYTEPRKQSGQDIGGPVVGAEIPYIHQRYDVAAYNGSYAYGPCACAPSTSCMVLGYYNLLQPHSVSSRGGFGYPSTDYAYYVGQVYTHPVTGYTFSQERMSSCGGAAAGGYGFMWTNGSPSSKMGMFYTNNNCASNAYDNRGMTVIRQECQAGMPYSWCITSSKTSGHLILPYRADAEYVNINGEWTYQSLNGSVVVHDPYGNANQSNWGHTDGRSVTYDYSGYNNGHLQMVNAWGVAVHMSRTPCHIAYVLNGGQFVEESVPTEYFADLTLPIPVKDGCEFMGWFADKTYAGSRYSRLYPGCGVDTVYALWSDMPLVKYVLNGGTLPEGVELPAIIEDTFLLPTPLKTGFTFTGWLWETDMLGDAVTYLYPGDSGRLWATWTIGSGLPNLSSDLRYTDGVVLNPQGHYIELYSASGSLIASSSGDLSLRSLPAGVYIVRAENEYLKLIHGCR